MRTGSKLAGGTSSTGKRTDRGTGIVSSSNSLGAGLAIAVEASPGAMGRSTHGTGTWGTCRRGSNSDHPVDGRFAVSTGCGNARGSAHERSTASRQPRSSDLDTFDFQARGFYERLGYETFAEVQDFPRGHSRFFMKKTLGTGT